MVINLKRKHVIIWSILLLLGICVVVFLIFKLNRVTYGKKLVLEDNTLNIASYYAEYDMTIISNKNINTYFVKEWYKEGVGNKIEYLDYMKNIITVITTPNDCYISNAGNKSYILTKNVYGTNNILSLATYISLFNNKCDCGCNKNVYLKDSEINLVFNSCTNDTCSCCSTLKDLGIELIELSILENKPTTYTIYIRDKKEYACIVYNKFDANIEIMDTVFSISK